VANSTSTQLHRREEYEANPELYAKDFREAIGGRANSMMHLKDLRMKNVSIAAVVLLQLLFVGCATDPGAKIAKYQIKRGGGTAGDGVSDSFR
jgi:hypothetical protein